jgi:GntR family transcriptional regulator, galactonate operon transcriptional repressor
MTKMGTAITLERAQYPDRSLHDRVVHAIGRKILGGELPPGALLPAEPELGASRTVLREAIKVLAAKGLVEARPKTGTRVRPRDAWNLLDPDVLAWQQGGASSPSLLRTLTEVRHIIEPAAAELAASRAGAGDLAAIGEALAEMERTAQTRNGNVEPFVQADMRFHLAILHACRNELLEQMSRVVYSALLVSFRATSSLPGRASGSLPKHRAIFDAIRARDPRGAAAAMRHLVQATAREVEAMSRRPRARRQGPAKHAR